MDTECSEIIFKEYEEGKEDEEARLNKTGRRDWLVIADIYNHEDGDDKYNQRFHLINYLKFRLNNGLGVEDNFEKRCYPYFNNVALILYTREVVLDHFKKDDPELMKLFNQAKEHYQEDGKINNRSFASKMRY